VSPIEPEAKVATKPRARRARPPEPPPKSLPERAFPTIMRYAGLLLAMYEGVIDRPPQPIVVALASVMMAGAQVLESIVKRRGM
jgi:hypothetical protein